MRGIVERILRAKVSAADMERALAAVNPLLPEDRTDIAARGPSFFGSRLHRLRSF